MPFIAVLTLFLFLNILQLQSENVQDEIDSQTLFVDTVQIDQFEYAEHCFELMESVYPQISGLENIELQNTINQKLKAHIIKTADSLSVKFTCDEIETITHIRGALHAGRFEILTLNHQRISILWHFTLYPSIPGNHFTPFFKIINVDVEKEKFVPGFEFNGKIPRPENVVARMHAFYHNKFPEFKSVSINYFEDKYPFSFALQNDRLVLIHKNIPGSFSTNGVYVIPVK